MMRQTTMESIPSTLLNFVTLSSHWWSHTYAYTHWFPGYSAPTPAGLQEWAVKQMYQFCCKHELPEVWVYLWENWYRAGRWEIWACSCNPCIPVIEDNHDAWELVSILLQNKWHFTHYSHIAGITSRKTFSIISTSLTLISWYGSLWPNLHRHTIGNWISQWMWLGDTMSYPAGGNNSDGIGIN